MIKLLAVDLRRSVPGPQANPEVTELLDEIRLNSGRLGEPRWKPVKVRLEDDRDSPAGLTDFVRTVPFAMASRRFVAILRKYDCECEYLPLIVHYHGKQLEGEYFALNALRVARDALDLERSKIGFYDEEFRLAEDVEMLVLKNRPIGDTPLAYLREISAFAVSEQLAQAIAEAGLVGLKLLNPEEFNS